MILCSEVRISSLGKLTVYCRTISHYVKHCCFWICISGSPSALQLSQHLLLSLSSLQKLGNQTTTVHWGTTHDSLSYLMLRCSTGKMVGKQMNRTALENGRTLPPRQDEQKFRDTSLDSSNSSQHTFFVTSSGVMFGTSLIENLPITFLGITVLAPEAEKAPSIPWRDKEGYLHLCIRISLCRHKEKDARLHEVWQSSLN